MLPESAPTFGHDFQRAGYDVSLIGKAHFQPLRSRGEYRSLEGYPMLQDLDFWRSFHGPFYGFNHVELTRNHADEAHVGQHYALWMEEKGCRDWRRFFRPPTGETPAQHGRWNIPEELHYNTWITERTLARVEACAGQEKPFFAWASYFDPHPPYLVPAPWDAMYDPATLDVPEGFPGEHARNPAHFGLTQQERPDFSAWREPLGHDIHGFQSHLRSREERARDLALYYGMVSCLDAHVGRLLAHLDSAGLAENTLVIFTSDHGHFFGQHGLVAKGPFHYEDLIRVPLLARFPGKIPAGRDCAALQSLVDLAPTFHSFAGLEVPSAMAGVDQREVWNGSPEPARRWALVENRHQPTTLHLHTLVEERYKITVYRGSEEGELFDLRDDPCERVNLWDDPAHAPLKAALLQRFVSAEMEKEGLPMPRIAGA